MSLQLQLRLRLQICLSLYTSEVKRSNVSNYVCMFVFTIVLHSSEPPKNISLIFRRCLKHTAC